MWRTITTLALLAMMPVPAIAKPCSCREELAALDATLADISAQRDAYAKVLMDYLSPAPPKDGLDAKARFQKYMAVNNAAYNNIREVGHVSMTGDVKKDPAYIAGTCDVIVTGTDKHENAHFWFFWSNAIPEMGASPQELGAILVLSELDARATVLKYLEEEIAKRKKQCGRELSSDRNGGAGSNGSAKGSAD
jgi:hypothetical protein